MNKTLMVILLFIHGSMSGKILLSKLSNTGDETVKTEAQSFFESIPLKDRVNFIIFYLTKGLQLKTSEDGQDLTDELPDSPESFTEFEDLVEPENFSQDLLEWTQDEFEMEDTDVARLLTHNVVCLDNGRCIRANDVGSNCCIF